MSDGHSCPGAANEIQDSFRARRTRPGKIKRRIALQKRMCPVEEYLDSATVPTIRATHCVHHTPDFIEPLAVRARKRFPRFASPPQCRFRDHGSDHAIGAQQSGKGLCRARKKAVRDAQCQLHFSRRAGRFDFQKFRHSHGCAGREPGGIGISLKLHRRFLTDQGEKWRRLGGNQGFLRYRSPLYRSSAATTGSISNQIVGFSSPVSETLAMKL